MNTKKEQPWEVDLGRSAKQLLNEIIEQIPEGASRDAFIVALNLVAAPKKEVRQELEKLWALERNGVDNWEWYDDAMSELLDDDEEDENV